MSNLLVSKAIVRNTKRDSLFFLKGGRCLNSWQLQEDSCLLGGDTAITWSQGEQYCMEQSATLVKADSELKINAINSIHESEACWIGLRDDKYNLECKWFDWSEFDYSNWDSEKLTRYGRKHCAIMTDNGEGKWFLTTVKMICGGILSARRRQLQEVSKPLIK